MKYLIFISFCIYTLSLAGQHSKIVGKEPCSKGVYITSKFTVEYPTEGFNDFVELYTKRNYPNTSKYLNFELNKLKEFQPSICLLNLVYFEGRVNKKKITLTIESKSKSVNLDLAGIHNDKYRWIREELSDSLDLDYYYGKVYEKDEYIEFDEITSAHLEYGQDSIIASFDLFSDLLSPNFCFNLLSIKPAKLFYDQKCNSIFLYIIGKLEYDDVDGLEYGYDNIYETYVAKIIFDLNSGKCNRVVIPGAMLETYGWMHCPEYWIF